MSAELQNKTKLDSSPETSLIPEGGADFEEAIAQTGFGNFNLVLLLAAIPPVLTSLFETLTLAYVFPAAECDLNLTSADKGMVNAVIFAGMMISSFLLGSAVDLYGRRRILFLALLLELVFAVLAAFSTSFTTLLVAKFLGGFFMVGNASALSPYLSEFHGKKYRPKVPLVMGFLFTLGNICLPLLAWQILTTKISFTLFRGYELHSWNVFLLVCALPPLFGTIIFVFMPESPKFLMTQGENKRALEIFEKIYKCNNLKTRNFPVSKLLDERNFVFRNAEKKSAWRQLNPLFKREYLPKLLLVCSLQFCLLMCHNTLRQWWPQIYQTMNDYELSHNNSGSFCAMMDSIKLHQRQSNTTCTINFEKSSPVYMKAMTAAVITMCGYFSATFLITALGKRRLLNILGVISSGCLFALYFAQDSSIAFGLICSHIMSTSVCRDTIVSVIIELFPTSLRASALSLAMVSGRIGSIFGNIAFPVLLTFGCGPPFFTAGLIILGWTVITLILPNTDLKSLK